MSYDLYFHLGNDKGDLSDQEFRSYFDHREGYSQEGPNQYFYQNENTGVYFSFDLERFCDEENGEEYWVSFNLNFFRPHYFALEARPELEAFCEAFPVSINDPQYEGMGQGEFVGQKFLDGWNAGNKVAYNISRKEEIAAEHVLPTRKLEEIWTWNYQLKTYQESLGESIFVPTIAFVRHDGSVKTGVVWSDGIATAIPDVDVLMIYRQELAPLRWFRQSPGIVIVERAEFGLFLNAYDTVPEPAPHVLLDYATPPDWICEKIRKLPPDEPDIDVVAADSVLNAELFPAAD